MEDSADLLCAILYLLSSILSAPSHLTPRTPAPAFFFSSRRRHTSSLRDWSSDVCSSDLLWNAQYWSRRRVGRSPSPRRSSSVHRRAHSDGGHLEKIGRASCRKECRCRGVRRH